MKRWLVVAVGLVALILPAQAEKRVSIAQLQQAVAQFKGTPDTEFAQRLSDLKLTERLSQQNFESLTNLLPGEKSRQALLSLADQSAFLDPPASEIPSNPAPSVTEQRRIMGLVVSYVKNAIPQLPNFFATRTTDHFEDTPLLQRADQFFIPYQPLHLVGRSQATVLYRGGREVVETNAKQSGKQISSTTGLTTWGVFGPILGSVLVDAAQSKLAWSHWEQGTSGLIAVFEFHVPQEKSHYEVNYCCTANGGATNVATVHPFRRIVPFHGSMSVDPSTGVILRMVLEAELKTADPVTKAAILVDYGQIEIAGKTYTCPLRSISTTVAQMVQVDPVYKYALANQIQPLKTELNDVSFNQYHVFRTDMRVLTPEEADLVKQSPPATVPAAAPPPGLQVTPQQSTEMAWSNQPGNSSATSSPGSISDAPSSVPSPTASTPAEKTEIASAPEVPSPAHSKPDQPETPEISVAAAANLPDTPATPPPAPPETSFHLQTTSRLVEVSVVAFDKKGHPITDLKPGDLELYDNGRKQTIGSFSQAESGASQPVPNTAAPAAHPAKLIYSNRPATASSAPVSSPRPVTANTTVLLLDAGHVVFADLTHARSEMLRFLKTVPADEPVGLYVMRKYGFEILREPTTDHTQIAATLNKWMPSAQDLLQAQNEEERNRQQMEYVRSKNDLLAMNGNTPTGEGDIDSAPDPQRRSLGDNPQRDVLSFLVWIARHLAATPGHKNLVWVASDNVLADFSEKAPDEEKGDKHLEPLALRAREALNEAHVSIYPLDTSQLEAGVVTANLQHANVQVNPTSIDVQRQGTPGGSNPSGDEAQQAMEQSMRDINPGRLTAQMQQDTHPIQPVFRDLAEATGGRALRRASDIAAELDSIVNDGRAAYQLTFTPDTPADNEYHHITIKVNDRRKPTLRYRTGYFYAKEPATLKDRFREAVWRPADLTEIGLTATPANDATNPQLRLNIAATDIALAERGGFWMDKLDIFVIQRDDAALNAKIDGQTLAMRLKPATYQKVFKDGINLDEPVKSIPKDGALRVVVVDENTGRIGTLTIAASAIAQKP